MTNDIDPRRLREVLADADKHAEYFRKKSPLRNVLSRLDFRLNPKNSGIFLGLGCRHDDTIEYNTPMQARAPRPAKP